MRILYVIPLMLLMFSPWTWAQSKGVTFQAVVKDPGGNLVNVTNATVNAKIIAPNGCVLRDENFTGVNIVNGYMNLNITKGSTTGYDPSLTVQQAFDNSITRNSLTCINLDGSVNGGVTSYVPLANDARKLRIKFVMGVDTILADFNIRSTPFAMNSETLNGVADTGFIKVNNSQNLTQTNAESIFNRYTKLDAILNNFNAGGSSAGINITGNAANVTGVVAIANGGTGANSASGARTNLGLGSLSTISPTGTADATTYLRGDGTWASISTSGAVTSVAGRTGAVTLSNTDISGLGPLATMSTSGTADNTKFLRGDGAWTAISSTDATKLPLSGGTMSGSINMGSQDITSANNISASNVSANNGSFTNVKIYDGSANYLTQTYPTGGTSYSVKWPANIGTTNQLLQITGVAGGVATLGWGNPASSGVSSVTAAGTAGNPIVVSGTGTNPTVDISKASGSTNGYLSSADWTTFNNKQPANTELNGLSGIASTGIIQRTGSGTYTALGTTTPLLINAGNLEIASANATTSGYITSADWNTFNSKQGSLGFTPLNPSNNLSDLSNATTARTNLGLGGAATLNVGTGAGTVAAGNDSRITGAVQNAGSGAGNVITSIQSGNTAGLPAAGTDGRLYIDTQAGIIYRDNGSSWVTVANVNGAGGTITQVNAGAGIVGGGNSGAVSVGLANIADKTVLANTSGGSAAPVATSVSTLVDTLAGATTQGSVLYRDVTGWSVLTPGTSGQYLQTQGASANPVWASAPTSTTNFSGSLSGDVSGTQSLTSVDKIKGNPVSNTGLANGKYLKYSGGAWSPAIVGVNDLVSSVTGVTQFTSASCNTNQTLTWTALTDSFACQNIALPNGQVTGLGALATKSSVDLSTTDATGTLSAARMPALTGDVTTTAGTVATTIANNAVTAAKIANSTITNTQIAAGAAIAWSKIDKTGAAASDIGAAPTVGSASITTVGTVTTGTWNGSTIPVAYGGTGTTAGNITGTGALTFTAGGSNTNVNLVPNGTGTVDVASKKITNLATPTASTDAATKAYVDAAGGSSTVVGGNAYYSVGGTNYYCQKSAVDVYGGVVFSNVNDKKQCAAGNWCSAGTCTAATEACITGALPSAGGACSNSTVYAGTLNGYRYMTTPGGCTNSTTPTCAGGTDTVMKMWAANTGTTAYGVTTGAASTSDGWGNSVLLVANYTDVDAANFCRNMNYGGYTDWYLPAKDELNLLYASKAAIGGFATANPYWSSTDYYTTYSWSQSFSSGTASYYTKANSFYVRCVRRF